MATCPNCNKTIDDDSYYCEHCGAKLYACPKCHIIGKGEGKRCGQCGTKLVEASSIGQAAAGQPVQQPAQPVQQPIQQPVQPGQQPGQPVQQPIQQPYQQPIQQPVQQPGQQPGQQQYNSFATSQAPVTSPGAAGSSIPPGTAGNGYGTAGVGYGAAGTGYGTTGGNNNAQPAYQGTAVSSPASPTSLYCAALNVRLPLFDGALIGRTTGNFVDQLSMCKYISGRHAQLSQTPTGWVITDLGSTNGTRVNGIPCAPSQPFTVGSIVRIANFYDFRAE